MLPHLHNGWQVDQAILSEDDRIVVSEYKTIKCVSLFDLFSINWYKPLQVIRFGHDWDPACMVQDENLYQIAEQVKNFAVIYLVDITQVPDFNKM